MRPVAWRDHCPGDTRMSAQPWPWRLARMRRAGPPWHVPERVVVTGTGMSDYVPFEAVIEPMVWGNATYTVVRLPEAVLDRIGPTKRVEGEFADHPVNLAIARAPVIDGAFLWAGRSLIERIGVAPGERFEARLRAVASDVVEVPADVTRALRSAGVTEAWEALTPGQKRRALYQIESAKRADTRARRLSSLCASLTG